MNKLMLESCVHSWDPNNVYTDKCKRFVSNYLQYVKKFYSIWNAITRTTAPAEKYSIIHKRFISLAREFQQG